MVFEICKNMAASEQHKCVANDFNLTFCIHLTHRFSNASFCYTSTQTPGASRRQRPNTGHPNVCHVLYLIPIFHHEEEELKPSFFMKIFLQTRALHVGHVAKNSYTLTLLYTIYMYLLLHFPSTSTLSGNTKGFC